jgi:hypothetical protein
MVSQYIRTPSICLGKLVGQTQRAGYQDILDPNLQSDDETAKDDPDLDARTSR